MTATQDDALAYCPFYRWAKRQSNNQYIISCENPLSMDESQHTTIHNCFSNADEWDNHFINHCCSKRGCKKCLIYQANMKKYC